MKEHENEYLEKIKNRLIERSRVKTEEAKKNNMLEKNFKLIGKMENERGVNL